MLESLIVRCSFAMAFVLSAGCVYLPSVEHQAAAAAAAAAGPPAPDPSAAPEPTLETRHFELDAPDQEVVGSLQVLFARHENTFSAIARHYDLGFEELKSANPEVDPWLPGEATPVYLPTESVLPDAPRDGIVLNLPSMRLLYFTREAADAAANAEAGRVRVTSHPVGIGRQGWATPTGEAVVTEKARDPIWYVPASVRAEHEAAGDPLPSVVEPGPDNPLGRFAIGLSMPGYLIHGTNKPAGVGMRVSHGCIRLYPEDIEALFDRVPAQTPVYIVDQPVLAGWRAGVLYLEVHEPLAEDTRDLAEEAQRVIAAALERAGSEPSVLHEQAIERILAERRGIPFPVTDAAGSPVRHLASARVIENAVPVASPEQTAQAD